MRILGRCLIKGIGLLGTYDYILLYGRNRVLGV